MCARRGSGLARGRLVLAYKLIKLSTPRCGDVRVAPRGISPAIYIETLCTSTVACLPEQDGKFQDRVLVVKQRETQSGKLDMIHPTYNTALAGNGRYQHRTRSTRMKLLPEDSHRG
jgi:hypothetical protein